MAKLKLATYKYSWQEILGNPVLNRLANRINKRWLFMSESDIEWIINECMDTKRMLDNRSK